MVDTGGNYGKGGDLVYRFGNPSAYNNESGERLFYNTYLIHGVKRRNASIRVPKTEWKLSTQNKVNLTETLKLQPKI